MVKRLVLAAAITWYYFVHLPALRLAGPRCAFLGGRLFAWLHWLLLTVGPKQNAHRALARVLPLLAPGLGVSTALRRNLAQTHQVFLEWVLGSTGRGRRFFRRAYRVEGREHLDAALAQGRGAIVLLFHFGMYRMVLLVLKMLGYEPTILSYRESTYAETTFAGVARATRNWWVRADRGTGVHVIYHRPDLSFLLLSRILRRGELVGIAADGMGGTEFVDLPFLGGTLRLPTGPARLAARTGAPIIPAFAVSGGWGRRRLVIHPPVTCAADSAGAVEASMAEYVRLFEGYVRLQPWAWLVWHRLEVDGGEDGRPRYRLKVWSPAGRAPTTPSGVAARRLPVS